MFHNYICDFCLHDKKVMDVKSIYTKGVTLLICKDCDYTIKKDKEKMKQ